MKPRIIRGFLARYTMNKLPIKEVAIDLGFTNSSMFSREFQLFHGVKPTDFQRREIGRASCRERV